MRQPSQQIEKLLDDNMANLRFQKRIKSHVGEAEFHPDYYLLKGDDGILVEVERGKILMNNMDMLDFWKCHIDPRVHHLILVVPVWHETSKGIRAAFLDVYDRMKPMFEQGNYTNVWSLHIVGY